MLKLFSNISVFLKDKYVIFNVSEALVASRAQIYYSLSGEICLLYTSMIQNISQQLPAASRNAKKQLYIVHVLYRFTTKLHFFLIMYLCLILFVNMLVFYFWLWSCINFIRHFIRYTLLISGDSTRWWKYSSEIMVQSDTVIWIQQVSWLHDQFCPIPKVAYWIEIAIWVVWTDCHVQEITHPAGRSHQKKYVTLKQRSVPTGHCSRTHEQMNMPRTYPPHQNTTTSSLNDWQDWID